MLPSSPKLDPFAALCAAIQASDERAVREILARHESVASRLDDSIPGDGFGTLPLCRAVERKDFAIVDQLLAAGANIDAKNHWWAGGFSPIDSVPPELGPEILKRGATLTAYAAARLGMLDELRGLVASTPDVVHMRGGDGQTPLHVAANVDVARFLLDHGADIDALDVDHESTAAMYHVRERTSVTRFLMDAGCRTDILMAAAVGDAELVRRSLDDNPDLIRATVSPDWFPMKNQRAGGTIYIWTLGRHKSPYAIAKEFGRPEVYNLLMDRTPDSLKLAIAVELNDSATVAALSSKQSELVAKFGDAERTKLTAAAEANKTELVRQMLRIGWPAAARVGGGPTALHWAGFHGNLEMARDLIRAGAPLDVAEGTFGGTPLGWTLYGSENGWHCETGNYVDTTAELLDAGATLSPREKVIAREDVMALLARRGVQLRQ